MITSQNLERLRLDSLYLLPQEDGDNAAHPPIVENTSGSHEEKTVLDNILLRCGWQMVLNFVP